MATAAGQAPVRRSRWWLVLVVATALAAPLGWIHHAYRHDLDVAYARIASGNAIVQTRCGPIEYASVGEGLPVLVVHGAGGGFDQGLEIGAALVAHGFRVIAPSRFGYLQTPLPPNASPTAQADAHACLLDALGIERVGVLGASAGAPSSVQLALRHPGRIDALVLLVPAIYVPRPNAAPSVPTPPGVQWLFDHALRSDLLLWTAIKLAREHLIGSILATPPGLLAQASADERDRVQRMLELTLPVTRRRAGLLNEAQVMATLVRYELERVRAPTLTLSAADDAFGTYDAARYSAEQIPGGRFVGFADGGHLLVGHQQAAMAEIIDWLSRHAAHSNDPRRGDPPTATRTH